MFSVGLGGTAQLRPLEVWQAGELADHLDRAREHIRAWVGPSFLTDTEAGARATLTRYAQQAAADGARLFGIWLDDRLVGGVMFVAFDPLGGTCELGCWLEPAAEGRGLVGAACAVLLHWAFLVRGLHRAEWRCRVDNVRSAAVAERLGMQLEGVHRQAWWNGGRYHDKQVWAVLAQDWRDPDATDGQPAGVRRAT